MTRPEAEPCPGENNPKPPVGSPVADAERLVRFLSVPGDFMEVDCGLRVNPLSFSKQDINGKKDKDGARAVSTFRFDFLCGKEIFGRAKERTGQERPLVATAEALAIRLITDQSGRRELCVFADCSEATQSFSESPLHASIRKSEPAYPQYCRQDVAILRSALADAFTDIFSLLPPPPAADL